MFLFGLEQYSGYNYWATVTFWFVWFSRVWESINRFGSSFHDVVVKDFICKLFASLCCGFHAWSCSCTLCTGGCLNIPHEILLYFLIENRWTSEDKILCNNPCRISHARGTASRSTVWGRLGAKRWCYKRTQPRREWVLSCLRFHWCPE